MSPESETVELGGLSAQRASAATPSGVFEPTRAPRDIDRQYVRSVQTSSAAIAIPGPERLQQSRPSLLADSRRGLRGASIALRHRSIRHSDVLLLARGEGGWAVDRRLEGRPTGASARFHLTAEPFIK